MLANKTLLTLAALLTSNAVAFSQPTITRHPVDHSVSLGANVSLTVVATGVAPFFYQWQFNGSALAGATNRTLVLTNVALQLAGQYAAVVSNSSGSVTSKIAVLEIDPAFTKITAGPVVNDAADGEGAAWVDFDNDGDLDLSVVSSDTAVHLLYRNDGTNGFAQIRDGVLSRDATAAETAAWADFDNDGLLDVFVSKAGGYVFRQNPLGTFTRSALGAPNVDWGVAAADYNQDGFVDLIVRSSDPRKTVWFNNGAGGFTVSTNNSVITSATSSIASADFDGDGDVDIFVARGQLYRNDGRGIFTAVTMGAPNDRTANGTEAAWGDYDNDGFPDLFLGRIDGSFQQRLPSFLFHNNGDGTFTQIEQPPFTDNIGFSVGCSWGDYDNDGWLDLFVAEYGPEKNRLFRNNANGTFTRILSGSIANDQGSSTSGVWGDYDRDGFLDLFVANGVGGNGGGDFSDYLYRNNGNKNGWLTIKLIGTVSNRSAIGAKVRVKATIQGKPFWQLREISTGGGWVQNAMEAHFGLGDATNVETLRVEWPSGTVQTFTNVAARQFITVHEPPQLLTAKTNRLAEISLRGGRGFRYRIDASTDLTAWSALAQVTVTNSNGVARITDTNGLLKHKFYRAVEAN